MFICAQHVEMSHQIVYVTGTDEPLLISLVQSMPDYCNHHLAVLPGGQVVVLCAVQK